MATTPSGQTEDSSPPPYDFNLFSLLEGPELDNAIVSINRESVSSLAGVTVGTPVLLRAITHGRRGLIGQTICILQTDPSVVSGTVRVNSRVMYSLGIGWGDKVLIERCPNIRYGQSIKLSPVQDCLKFIDGDIDTEFLKPYFEVGYRPVHIGDLFLVKDKSGSKAIEVKVKDCDPSPYCLVSPSTQVLWVDPEPREIGDNMLHEFHERRAELARTIPVDQIVNNGVGTTGNRSLTMQISDTSGQSLEQGDIVTVVRGADGRPRLQRVPRSQVAVAGSQPQITCTRTILVNDNSREIENRRATYLCIRLCVCIVLVVVGVVGGLAGGLGSHY